MNGIYTGKPITVGRQTIHLPYWTMRINDDGTWYVNEYRNCDGIIRRETIADKLSVEDARRIIAAIKEFFASM